MTTQIFVSYKSEDRERLTPLVAALEAEGFRVWWDAQIEGGQAWRDRIEHNLESARCVVVAWSERSVAPEGRFVRDEAGRALERGVYLPVLLDQVRVPIGFGEVQALSLVGWKGSTTDPRFRAVLSALRARLDSHPADEPAVAATGKPKHEFDRRALIAGGSATLLAAGVGGWWISRKPVPAADPADKSIAVLPFANLSDDPGQTYFADGLAEELRGALTRIGQIKVIARTSCEAVRNSPVTKAARELGVARILTGSVRRSPSIIRVSAQLVDGANGVELWSETYDRPPGDVLQIQAGIATSVVESLRIRLAPAQKAALVVTDTTNVAAHDLYLRAMASLRSSSAQESAYREALRLLNEAIKLDPNYVAALAESARVRVVVANAYESGDVLRSALTESLATARRAVSLNPNSAVAHSALAYVRGTGLDIPGALEGSQRAYRLGPGDPGVVYEYGFSLMNVRRYAEGLSVIGQVISFDPLDPRPYVLRGRLLFALGRQPESVGAFRRALAIRPKFDSGHSGFGDLYVCIGRPKEALAEYEQVSNAWDRLRGLAIARDRMGDRAGSDRELAELRKLDDGSLNFQFAQIHASRGEFDLAVQRLEAAYDALDGGLQSIYSDPFIEPVMARPQVQELLQRLGFISDRV